MRDASACLARTKSLSRIRVRPSHSSWQELQQAAPQIVGFNPIPAPSLRCRKWANTTVSGLSLQISWNISRQSSPFADLVTLLMTLRLILFFRQTMSVPADRIRCTLWVHPCHTNVACVVLGGVWQSFYDPTLVRSPVREK